MSQAAVNRSNLKKSIFELLSKIGSDPTIDLKSAYSSVISTLVPFAIEEYGNPFNWVNTLYFQARTSHNPIIRTALDNVMQAWMLTSEDGLSYYFGIFFNVTPSDNVSIGTLSDTSDIVEWISTSTGIPSANIAVQHSPLLDSAASGFSELTWTKAHIDKMFENSESPIEAARIATSDDSDTSAMLPFVVKVTITDAFSLESFMSSMVTSEFFSYNGISLKDPLTLNCSYYDESGTSIASVTPLEVMSLWNTLKFFEQYSTLFKVSCLLDSYISEHSPSEQVNLIMGTLQGVEINIINCWTAGSKAKLSDSYEGDWVYKGGEDPASIMAMVSDYVNIKYTGVSCKINPTKTKSST